MAVTGTLPNDSDKVDVQSVSYQAMSEKWKPLHALLGGTNEMRERKDTYLPREEKETKNQYDIRVARSYLFNAYGDTVGKLSDKPFTKPVTISGAEGVDWIEEIQANVDGVGTEISQFGRELLNACLVYGKTHVLVDFPFVPGGLTMAEEKELGVRPTFVHYTAVQLLGWKSEVVNGKRRLLQIRLYEVQVEPSGLYGDWEVEYIRVFNAPGTITEDNPDGKGTWELWRKTPNDDEFKQDKVGTHTFGEIPFITIYAEKTGFMTAEPPLYNLAQLNIAHFQSYSDYRHALRFQSFGMVFISGITQEEADDVTAVGPNRLIHAKNPEAKASVIEHQGKALAAAREHLKMLEELMQVLGLQPLMQKSSSTATGEAIREGKNNASIQTWIRAIEAGIYACYEFAAKWGKQELPSDFGVDIFSDFALSYAATKDIELLLKAREKGEISRETFLYELKRRAMLDEATDIDEEMERIDQEGPKLFEIGLGDSGEDMGGDKDGDEEDEE